MRLVSEVPIPCVEQGCGGMLRRRWQTRYERFSYVCDRRFCSGAVGCHPDGSPLGRPADKATRRARMRAHRAFDQLWKPGSPVRISRSAAYRWLAQAMGKPEVHMAQMDVAECDRVVELCSERTCS